MDRYKDIPDMEIEDLESELNFYQWLIDNEEELGGIEMSHKVWLQALKIEVKRRGLKIEKKIILVKGDTGWGGA